MDEEVNSPCSVDWDGNDHQDCDLRNSDTFTDSQINITSRLCPWVTQNPEGYTSNESFNEISQDEPKRHGTKNDDSFKQNELKETMEKRFSTVTPRIRTSDIKPYPNASFNALNIKPTILLALSESGWEWPSPIQEETILKMMMGKNIVARAKNGTGKTGAYSIGLLNKIDTNSSIQAVILVPTRELALQTANVCISLSKYMKDVKVMVTTGGTNLVEDLCRLSQSVNVIVGTPGRFLNLLLHNKEIFLQIETIILDEADKLLSIDFQLIIEEILNLLPKNCQKLLFSATYPMSLRPFVNKYLKDCEYCNVMKELVLKGVTQYYAYLNENQKTSCLKLLLQNLDIQQSIIFCNSAKRVELLSKFMTEIGYSSYYIHSKMNQESRNRVFHDFRSGFVTFLVCTDVISRGIDIPTVNVVFNFDFPKFNESYLHRIGRCGRFGHLGIAINFVIEEDKECYKQFERELDTHIYAIPRMIDKRLYVSSYQTRSEFSKTGELC